MHLVVLPWRLTAGLFLATGLLAAVRTSPRTVEVSAPAVEPAPAPVVEITREPVVMHVEAPPALVIPPPWQQGGLAFVVEAGGASYVDLAPVDGVKGYPHGPWKRFEKDYVTGAIAHVRDDEVPDDFRPISGMELLVDGTCRAHVTGFALVTRVTGDPGYAGLEGEHWTTTDLVDKGTTFLAAKLDRCKGNWARPAALPSVIRPEQLTNGALSDKARALVLASDAARTMQARWEELGSHDRWTEHVPVTAEVVRHPKTGVTWVVTRAFEEHGCGEPDINLFGLFKVEADGSLFQVELRPFELDTIDELVDVDGDGNFDLVGRPWLGLDRVFESASGVVHARQGLPFFGCPC